MELERTMGLLVLLQGAAKIMEIVMKILARRIGQMDKDSSRNTLDQCQEFKMTWQV
jgi:hypothetical protein